MEALLLLPVSRGGESFRGRTVLALIRFTQPTIHCLWIILP